MCIVREQWKWMEQELDKLKDKHQFRQLYSTSLLQDGWIERDGRRMLNLASNDYLGLSQESILSRNQFGIKPLGSTASRLIVGSDPIYEKFEQEFATYKGTQSSLIFSNGYMANLGVISALVGRNDAVFSDRLNHASIVDGITLSRADHKRYHHCDLDHLERLLSSTKSGQKKLVITDSIFSMDGDLAPLKELAALKDKYGAILMVDEAHSGGIYGTHGQGLVHELGLTAQVEVQMGTFSKAYGCYGAYIAGDAVLINYLINHSRSFIYTTALPPAMIAIAEQQWERIKAEGGRRQKLHELSHFFRSRLLQYGFDTGASQSHIIPLMVGDNELTLEFSRRLQQEGIAAVAIRPPTVPEGTSRIRFTLMSSIRKEDLEKALVQIEAIGKELNLI